MHGTGVVQSAPTSVDRARNTWLSLVGVAAILVAFLFHFRPWEGGLLEDWGFVELWRTHGLNALPTVLSTTVGRPLHVLPLFLGLTLTNGGFVGMYLVLSLVAAAQVVATVWAVRSVTGPSVAAWLVGFVLAVHPWWAAGDILRFLPAQVSFLAFVLWLGFAIRLLQRWHIWMLLGTIAMPVLGLLTYQALALTYLIAAAVLVTLLHRLRDPRGWWLCVITPVTVGTVSVYSIVIAPRLLGGSYESQLMSGAHDVLASVRAILRTVLQHGQVLLVFGICVFIITAMLVARRGVSWQSGVIMLAVVPFSFLSGLTYAATPLHLNDPERVMFPIGATLAFICICWLLVTSATLTRALVIGVSVLAALSLVVAAVNLGTWATYAGIQRMTLGLVGKALEVAPPGSLIVIADGSGRLGDVYTLLPPHLQVASNFTFGTSVDVQLCTEDGVERIHPVAAVYPILTTEYCSTIVPANAQPPISSEFHGSHIDVYVIAKSG